MDDSYSRSLVWRLMLPWRVDDICSVLHRTIQRDATSETDERTSLQNGNADRSIHRHLANSNPNCSWASDGDSARRGDQGEFMISVFGIALGAGASYDRLWLTTSKGTLALATETQT